MRESLEQSLAGSPVSFDALVAEMVAADLKNVALGKSRVLASSAD
jgi:hypothetical protein